MKVVFFCIPAHGHTNPTLGVVKELIKNNHEVYYYSYEIMKEKIESTGAKFITCPCCGVESMVDEIEGITLTRNNLCFPEHFLRTNNL